MAATLEADRADIARLTPVEHDLAPADGQILCRVDRFALTANNVTYAAHGEDFRYWSFFPASDPRGVVPVWGFATVEASRAEGIEPGERFYGYWPMASHALLTPARVTPRGFVDAAPHRRELPAVYNGYQRIHPEGVGDERIWALFRPLYITSWLLAVELAARDGIAQVVLSSASSKTALGMAQAVRGTGGGRSRVVGLTSPANAAFVERTGYFDRVLPYAGVAELDPAGRAVFVDFSGNGEVRRAVHERLGDSLAASLIVGDTHWSAPNAAALPGPAPEMFFAPTVLAGRLAEWGQAGFDERLAGAWSAFVQSACRWLEIREDRGLAAVGARWAALVGGVVDPAHGIVGSLAAD